MATSIDVPSGAVVVGSDGSPAARRAVDWAAAEATRRNAPVAIVTAVESPTRTSGADLLELGERLVTAEASRVRESHPAFTATSAAVSGDAAVVLVDASHQADLMVIGARGLGPFSGLMLGSVSQKVAAHAHGLVVVVREEAPVEMPGPVVVGADPADPPVEALEYAFEEATRRSVGVIVISAGKQPRGGFSTAPAATAALADLAEDQQRQLVALVDQLAAQRGVSAQVQQLPGHPVDAILGVAGAESFIVVGSRGHSGLAGLLLGSISRGVIARALAVAVVRVLPTEPA